MRTRGEDTRLCCQVADGVTEPHPLQSPHQADSVPFRTAGMALVAASEEAETRTVIIVEWAKVAGLSPDDVQLLGKFARVSCFFDPLNDVTPVMVDF